MTVGKSAYVGCRASPSCGHKYLRECLTTAEDWRAVWRAWLAFLAECRLIAEDAHARQEAGSG